MRSISEFLKAVRLGIISDVPPKYQACEACREEFCSTEKALNCSIRVKGESQELEKRKLNIVK